MHETPSDRRLGLGPRFLGARVRPDCRSIKASQSASPIGRPVVSAIRSARVVGLVPSATRRLWAMGSLGKARYWEIIAVPDIRLQATQVAEAIAKELNNVG